MKRTLLASYVRESTIPKVCRSAWEYAKQIVQIDCCYDDRQDERNEHNILYGDCEAIIYTHDPVSGKDIEIETKDLYKDTYTIITTNARGVNREYFFNDKDEANKAFMKLKSRFDGWKRIKYIWT